MVARVVVLGVAALAMAGAGMSELALAQGRGHGGGGGANGGGGMRGGGGGAVVGGGGGGMRSAAPSFSGGGGANFRSGPIGPIGPSGPAMRSFSGPNRSFSGGSRFAGNTWSGNWRGDFRHGRHFRRFAPFAAGAAFAYTYPYYDDDYYGYDRCAYVDPGSWWWSRYCAPYGYYGY